MNTQTSFNTTFLRLSKMTAFILVMLSSFYVNGQSSGNAKWTEMSKNKNATFYDVQKNFNKEWKGKLKEMAREKRKGESGEEKEAAGFEVYKRWESYMAPRVYPSGDMSLPSNNYANYIAWQKSLPQNKGGGGSSIFTTGNWTALGPAAKPGGCVTCTGVGRVNFVRFDPTNSNTLYVGAPDGGLWKSTNSGTSWATVNTDFLSLIGVSDLAIDPNNTNIMYLATGDIEGAKNSIGVLKSTNGGATWNTTGLTFNVSDYYRIGKMLMHPTNSSILIVATNGGIYRTTNGGTTWTLTQCCGLFQDMEFKPGDPNTVYASGYEFWKSTNNGVNWSQITSGLPTTNVQRIALGVSAGNAAYVYALIGKASDQSFLGLYRSTNSGTSFTLRSSSPNLLAYATDGSDAGGQAFYDLSIAVNPTNAEIVTTGGVNQWQSTNGGTSWTIKSQWAGQNGVPFVHADVHEINYLPGSGTTFFSCNDGGFFKTTNDGTSWTDLSNNLSITQEVKIGLSASDPNIYVIGTQDNGTSKHSGATWSNIFGGDGGECFIDYTNNNTIYISYVYASWYRSTNGGTSFTDITSGLPASGSDFYSTWHQHPVTPNTLYSGGFNSFYRSTNQGTNWTGLGTPSGSGNIVDFAVAPSSPTTIYAIKYNAISKSTNGGTSFSNITGTLPVASAALTNLCVSNTDPLKVWVTFSGYSAGNKVYRSTNGGTSWTNVSSGLPNLPFNTIVYKNGSANDELYLGGDVGVYYVDNTLASWAAFNTNLPNVGVRDLEIYYPTSKLRAGTYGRGTWESDLNVTGGGCGTPTGATATSITQTGATISWGAVSGATSYKVQYRLGGTTTWTTKTASTTSKAITGLTAATLYNYRVRAVCGTVNSAYTSVKNFTTTSSCSDIYEPNNTIGTPANIAVNTDIYAIISTSTDNDYFKINTTGTAPKVKVTVDGLPADYDVILYYGPTSAQLGISQNAGTSDEQIIYNGGTTGVGYKVFVYGYNGAFVPTSCYHLKVSTSANPFREMGVGELTTEKPGALFLYPNPAMEQLTVSLLSAEDQNATINIIDMTGRMVLTTHNELSEGLNELDLNLSNVQNGIYMVQVNINGTTLTQKLVVQNKD